MNRLLRSGGPAVLLLLGLALARPAAAHAAIEERRRQDG